LFRGAARTALETGVPVSIRFGADALQELGIVLAENVPANRVLVAGLDRRDAAGAALEVARRGAFVGLDHVGTDDEVTYLDDAQRAALVLELVAAGFAAHIILSSNAIGVAKGQPATAVSFEQVLSGFIPLLKSLGLSDADAQLILISNPRELLTVR
jgi:phosphotriesterase-related protein